ncbi:MAG: VCBS domain-containing protein, partial [Gallionella sp.]|nr:VCBS domain-containing protein [Gallionella sp.]
MASNQDVVGKIVIINGAVFVQRDGKSIPANHGSELRQGDFVVTGQNGKAGIAMMDQTRFSLGEKASMKIDHANYSPAEKSGSMTVSFIKGAFMFITGQIAHLNGGNMKVRTASATIGIRGTQVAGDIQSDGSESTFTLLPNPDGHQSSALIENAGGSRLLDQPNQSVHIASYFTPPSEPFLAPPTQVAHTYGQVFPNMFLVSQQMGLPGPVNQQTYQPPPPLPNTQVAPGKEVTPPAVEPDSTDLQLDKVQRGTADRSGGSTGGSSLAVPYQLQELSDIRSGALTLEQILANKNFYLNEQTTVVRTFGDLEFTFIAPSLAAVLVNIPPSATADQYVLDETAFAPVTGIVTANDTDAEGNPLSVFVFESVNNPTLPGVAGDLVAGEFGSLSIAADGSFSYILDSGKAQSHDFAGATSVSDVFNYSIADGLGGQATSTVSFSIQDVNSGFLTSAFSSALINITTGGSTSMSGDILSATTVIAGVYDAAVVVSNFNTLTGYSVGNNLVAGNAALGQYGTLLLNPSGTYEYILDPTKVSTLAVGSSVTDNFVYTLSSGQVSSFTVNVNSTGQAGIADLVAYTYHYGEDTDPVTAGHQGNWDYYTGYTYVTAGSYDSLFAAGGVIPTLITEASLSDPLITGTGYYTIDSITAGQSGVIGQTRVTEYYDADTLVGFASPYVSGLAGIGSEKGAVAGAASAAGPWVYDYVNYFFEADIDLANTANLIQYYTYTYDYGNGDFYTGYGYAAAATYAAGQSVDATAITGLPGSYYIETVFSIQDSVTDNIAVGQVYVTSYYDANGALSDTTANASGTVGLGSERGNVFSTTSSAADAFDAFTSATISTAPSLNQLYYFHYDYGDTGPVTPGYQGDTYYGYGYANAGTFIAGQLLAGYTNELGTGTYTIDAIYTSDIGIAGEVFVSYYFDGDVGGEGWNTIVSGSGITGLGSESGTVYNFLGNTADTFSNYYEADVAGGTGLQLYYFHYDYGNGDTYYGYGYNDSALTGLTYTSNLVFNSIATETGATGTYTIDSVFSTTFGISGEVNVYSYYDSNGAGWNTYVSGAGQFGLGSEAGSVSNYTGANADVFSSYNSADVSGGGTLQQYYFNYSYGNGDNYYGYGYNDSALTGVTYAWGDTSTVTNELGLTGTYTIDSVYATSWGTSGEIYVNSYYDGDAGGAGWNTSVSGFGQFGLGSEGGTVYNYNGAAD